MAKFIAGKLVLLGNTHFNEGDVLPDKVRIGADLVPLEKLSNFKECMKDGTFKPAPAPELDVDEDDDKKPKPYVLPTLQEWTKAGYGREVVDGKTTDKLLEGKLLIETYEKALDGYRAEAKKQGRPVVEPAK